LRHAHRLALAVKLHAHAVRRRINVLPWFREHCITRNSFMLLIQLLGAFAVLYGVSYWSIPCALIVGGIGGIAAMEMQGHGSQEPKETAEEEQKIKARIDAALARGVNPFTQQAVPLSTKWMTYVALARRTRDAQ
jgi:hypothetical protein